MYYKKFRLFKNDIQFYKKLRDNIQQAKKTPRL